MTSRTRRWLFTVLAAHVVLLALGVWLCIPNRSLQDSLGVAGDNHIVFDLPTKGKISRSIFYPRYVICWGGRVDPAQLKNWVQSNNVGCYDRDTTSPEPWPWDVGANLPEEIRLQPFVSPGDQYWEWTTGTDDWYYNLMVNETKGTFCLLRAPSDAD